MADRYFEDPTGILKTVNYEVAEEDLQAQRRVYVLSLEASRARSCFARRHLPFNL
jgi:hypothetical protein